MRKAVASLKGLEHFLKVRQGEHRCSQSSGFFQVLPENLKISWKHQKAIMVREVLSGGQTPLKFLFHTAADLTLHSMESVVLSSREGMVMSCRPPIHQSSGCQLLAVPRLRWPAWHQPESTTSPVACVP